MQPLIQTDGKENRSNFIKAFDEVFRVSVTEIYMWLNLLITFRHPAYVGIELMDQVLFTQSFGEDGSLFFERLFKKALPVTSESALHSNATFSENIARPFADSNVIDYVSLSSAGNYGNSQFDGQEMLKFLKKMQADGALRNADSNIEDEYAR